MDTATKGLVTEDKRERYISSEMSVSKGNKKKHVRPKSEVHISEPFAFRHDIHVGHEDYDERQVGTRSVSPPTPCPGKIDGFEDTSIPGESFIQLLNEEVIPNIRREIGDIVEDKIKSLYDRIIKSAIPHCKTCDCEEPENSKTEKAETRSNLFERPKPCTGENVNSPEKITGKKMIHVYDQGHGKDLRHVSNPLYRLKQPEFLIQTHHRSQLVKYGSDIQLMHNEYSPEKHSPTFTRSNTLPRPIKDVQTPGSERNEFQNNHRGTPFSKLDERECMAHALQWHIEELVDGIVFKESELPDSLLADECLTEEECSGVRQKLNRKNQVRVLLSIIKGRDLDILKKFLKHIRLHNPGVARKIEAKFEQNKKEGIGCSKCALCKLTAQVNLRYIVDSLWGKGFIEDGLFNLIVETNNPTGTQGDLWHQVIHSLNGHKQADVRNVLGKALTAKQHYYHIAEKLERMLNNNRELKCCCKLPKILGTARSFMSIASSQSPQTSESDLRADSHSDISHCSFQTEKTTSKVAATEGIHKAGVKVHPPTLGMSQEGTIAERPDESHPIKKTTQPSVLGMPYQGIADQGSINRASINQGRAGQDIADQDSTYQGSPDQDIAYQGSINRASINQGRAGQDIADQDSTYQGSPDQDIADQGYLNHDITNQGSINQGSAVKFKPPIATRMNYLVS